MVDGTSFNLPQVELALGVCVCACTLIRPQDVNCYIPAHGSQPTGQGPRPRSRASGTRPTCSPHLGRSVYGKVMRYSALASRRQVPAFTLSLRHTGNRGNRATSHQSFPNPTQPQPPKAKASIIPRPPFNQTARPSQTMGPREQPAQIIAKWERWESGNGNRGGKESSGMPRRAALHS